MPTTLTANSRHAVIAKAILATCKPCCGAGSGLGSGGVTLPNGCAGCDCCPCVCWWYTQWHRSITASNLIWTPTPVAPIWTLTSNTLANTGGNPEYTYLGSTGLAGTCELAGVAALDGSGNITSAVPPNPYWTGVLTYTNGVATVQVTVGISLAFTLGFDCANPTTVTDAVVWSGTAVLSVSGGHTYDIATHSIDGQEADKGPPPNDFIGGSGTVTDCGGTIALDGDGIALPAITFVPMLEPGCTPS